MTPEFERLSETALRADSKSVKEFTNTTGGIMRAVGVSASCTGFRSKYNILDDPHISFEQLASRKYRDDIYDWYTGIFRSRLSPGGRELIVTTRFSADDLSGRLLEKEGERWDVLRIPEVADEADDPLGRPIGERLWPEYLSDDRLLNRERDPRLWLGCYMQKPPAESGSWLDADDLPIVAEAPKLKTIESMDLALTVGGGDYSVNISAGLDENRDLYITNVWRKQVAIEETAEALSGFCKRNKSDVVLIDDDNASKVFKQYCLEKFRKDGVYTPLKALPTGGQDKEVRAAAFRGFARQGRVFLVQGEWNAELMSEVYTFPLGRNDDQIDCLSLLGRYMAQMGAASPDVIAKRVDIKTNLQMVDGKAHTTQTMDELWDSQPSKSKIIRI
jgi:predicted phage terminase large subunit-like protein